MSLSDLIDAYEARVEMTQWVVWSNLAPWSKDLKTPEKVGYPFEHSKKKKEKPKIYSKITRIDGN
jgi:CRISPR/Cas system CMR-associated protein Cmr3 (group 5 of RAMP superfamily)